MNDVAKLIVCLNSYGFIPKEMTIVFEIGTLNNLDLLTYSYQNANDFFLKNRNKIINCIKKQIPCYEINVNFEFLELKSEIDIPIYIEMKEETLPVLFKTIRTNDKEENLEVFIKERLKNNGLYLLYLCDSYIQKDVEYESIFKNCNRHIYTKIMENLVKEEEIDYVWNFFKSKNRFFAIIRFLVNAENMEEALDCFSKMIPLKETRESNDYEYTRRMKQTWLPYKDSE